MRSLPQQSPPQRSGYTHHLAEQEFGGVCYYIVLRHPHLIPSEAHRLGGVSRQTHTSYRV